MQAPVSPRPHRPWQRALMALVALGAMSSTAHAQAPRDVRDWTDDTLAVELSVPETRADCSPRGMTDRLTTSGLPSTWRLVGQVRVGYVSVDGLVTSLVYPVDTMGNLDLTISYPTHAQITPNLSGMIEYRVEPSIEVYDESGEKVSWVGGDTVNAPGTLGPGGQDWSVYCRQPAPPPPAVGGCNAEFWTQVPNFPHYVGMLPRVTPWTTFNSRFPGFPLPNVRFYTAITNTGGTGLTAALLNLRRAGATAYLNAAKTPVNFGFTPGQVSAAIVAVARTGNADYINYITSIVDWMNNRGCPLD